jgi:fructokinase
MAAMALPAIGIDLGGTKIEARLFDAAGGERWRECWRERVAAPAGDYAATLDAIALLVRRAREASPAPPSIGIGTPGTVTADGRMKNCNSECLNGRWLKRDLEAALGQSVAVANDANCLALSEATDGAGAGAGVVFAAILGTGVGAGIAVHGRVLTGPNGVAGEWGHNPLPWLDEDTPRWACYCGRRGCIETLVSGPGLARLHALRHGGALAAAQIAAAAGRGDAASADTLERHAALLARALAGVINLLDPDVIVLGGGVSLIPHLYTRVPQLWGEWVVSGGVRDPVRTRLVPSQHGDASGVRGAAWLGRAAAPDPP